jgi:hypothetical protein
MPTHQTGYGSTTGYVIPKITFEYNVSRFFSKFFLRIIFFFFSRRKEKRYGLVKHVLMRQKEEKDGRIEAYAPNAK